LESLWKNQIKTRRAIGYETKKGLFVKEKRPGNTGRPSEQETRPCICLGKVKNRSFKNKVGVKKRHIERKDSEYGGCVTKQDRLQKERSRKQTPSCKGKEGSRIRFYESRGGGSYSQRGEGSLLVESGRMLRERKRGIIARKGNRCSLIRRRG